MFLKSNLLVVLQYVLFVYTVNLEIFKDFSPNDFKPHNLCAAYNKYFERTTDIKVFKLYSRFDPKYNEIEIYTQKLLRCLSRSYMAFIQKRIHIETGRDDLQTNAGDFEMITNETAKIRKNHEIWYGRKTSSRGQKGIILVSKTPEKILSYFEARNLICRRCLYLSVFTKTQMEENRIYYIMKKIWTDLEILNIVFHGIRSQTRTYWYIYNPFYLK